MDDGRGGQEGKDGRNPCFLLDRSLDGGEKSNLRRPMESIRLSNLLAPRSQG